VYAPGTELVDLQQGDQATVLGRSPDSFGEWFYVETEEGIKGYAFAPYFDSTDDIQALPTLQPTVTVTVLPTRDLALEIAPGTLRIVHVWPSSVCNREGGWTARFEVKIEGGDGRNYTLYWDDELISYTAKESERDVAIITRPGIEGLLVGTVRVISGGQEASAAASDREPDPCRYD
jgi:hypothetical protein